MRRYLIPVGVFVVLSIFLGIGLRLNPAEIPSPYIGKPAPEFSLQQLTVPEKQFGPKQMLGKVWLLNVWASWCTSCREEHAQLLELSNSGAVPIIGLDYKDQAEDGKQWLDKFGDPYRVSVMDIDGRVGLDYGVYGVPETFVIDKQGIVRMKLVGPVTSEIIRDKFQALIDRLNRE